MSWLRVVTYQLPDQGAAEAIEAIKAGTEEISRVLEELPGYGGGYWGESPEDNTVSGVTHWSSLEAIQAAEGELRKIQQTRDVAHGAKLLEVHNVGLFAVPAISGWLNDDDNEPEADKFHSAFPKRLARWRR
ncbi:MAG: hypothetical protein ACT4QG_03275 [Sporichthyaceae bacterium]